jgi:hexosaminidase
MNTKFLKTLVLIVLVNIINAQTIIPEPTQMRQGSGTFKFTPQTVISYNSDELLNEVNFFTNLFKITSGFQLESTKNKLNKNCINLVLDKNLNTLNNEGYELEIKKDVINIKASNPTGVFYAYQTIKQLLPPEVDGIYPVENLNTEVKCLSIKDEPRFQYRGYLLDVSRYFIPIRNIKKILKAMAFYKLNVFHWHLTDYQGWRLQIKKYPQLTLKGAKVNQTKWLFEGSNYIEDRIPAEGFYTQEEVKDLIAFAKKLHIRIIPEIDVPAHSIAAIAAYPHLTCSGEPQIVKEEKVGGMATVFCPGKETTFKFLEDVFDEVMALFPEQEIHIGADEVKKDDWEKCPHCKKRMEEQGLKSCEELQSYFVKRVENYLNKHNHNIIGWDEILEGGLAPNATVMSWRGTKGGIKAAKMGHKVIMTPTSHCYFDYCQGKDRTKEPYVRFKRYLPLSKVYSYDPIPEELNEKEAKLVLGAQANMWSNFIKNPSHAEYMTFPRLCAIAELTWSPLNKKDYEKFKEKLESHYPRLEQRHIIYRKAPQE